MLVCPGPPLAGTVSGGPAAMGDGYMVAFKSAADGPHCAIAIQQAIAGMKDGVRVRIGLNTGEVIREGDDFFGRRVKSAARGRPGQRRRDLRPSVVREPVSGQSFEFDDRGEQPVRV